MHNAWGTNSFNIEIDYDESKMSYVRSYADEAYAVGKAVTEEGLLTAVYASLRGYGAGVMHVGTYTMKAYK